jgi:multidrug efflux pump subunit AcrB
MNSKALVLLVTLVALLVVGGALALPLAAWYWFTGASAGPRPVVVVEVVYPGANAQTVADTVAAPIEQQVNGVERMWQMVSESRQDGTYTLRILFQPGTDVQMAQVLVQNRVSLALPVLPDVVNRRGLTVKKKAPGVLALVSLSSPNGRYDARYISNHATVQIRDELARVPGVADVVLFGPGDYAMRIWLDPEKLKPHDLTAVDVTKALQAQNLQPQAGQVEPPPGGGGFSFQLTTLGRLQTPEELENVILKVTNDGRKVLLKDVGRVELGAREAERFASLGGRDVVLLGAALLPGARPHEVSAALHDKVTTLGKHTPKDLQLDLAFDFTRNLEAPGQATTPEYVRVDVTLPDGASLERTREVVSRCGKLVRQVEGVQTVLELSHDPFALARRQPCLLVCLAPAGKGRADRDQIVRAVRARLGEVQEALVRLCDLAGPGRFPWCDYPVSLSIADTGDRGVEALTKAADDLAERLSKSGKLSDVFADREAHAQPQLCLEVDREAARDKGVALNDVATTLQTALGHVTVNDFNRFGRTWQLTVPASSVRATTEDLKRLKVRNDQGKMVPLVDFVGVRELRAPMAVKRVNLYPAVTITANPTNGVSLKEARVLCEREAAAVLPTGYRLIWLHED